MTARTTLTPRDSEKLTALHHHGTPQATKEDQRWFWRRMEAIGLVRITDSHTHNNRTQTGFFVTPTQEHPMSIPTAGYPSFSDAVAALTRQGLTPQETADRLNCTRRKVYQHRSYQNRRRNHGSAAQVFIDPNTKKTLQQEATKRGLTLKQLASKILQQTCADHLVTAVLDDDTPHTTGIAAE